MNSIDIVAVTSRSFSKNPVLRKELLSRYQNVKFNDDGQLLEGDSLVSFLQGSTKAITALEKMTYRVLNSLPHLSVISKYGVGLDMIDQNAMRQLGKRLGWTGGVNKRSVSELVVCFAIAMLRNIPAANRGVIDGVWRQHIGSLLSHKTVGIIGCGFIGKDLVQLLKAFQCSIIVNDIVNYHDFYLNNNIEAVSLDKLLAEADIVTLHVPLNDSTYKMLDESRLAIMKHGSILINAARGDLVDELALKSKLMDRSLSAAAFDVFSIEPPQDQELLELPNFLSTPHIGGSSMEAILAMGRAAIDGLDNHCIPPHDIS